MLFLRFCDEQDLVDLVDLDELHLDPLVARGRKVLADVVGADRKLAVAAVDEHGELDPLGPAVVEQRFDRGADRPAGVEDVVDEDDPHAVEREGQLGRADRRAHAIGDVVAIERDVDRARRRRLALGRGGLQWTFYVRDLDEVEAGWSVVPERWAQGLATELALASVDVAFGPLDHERIVAFTTPDNAASQRVMEKAGFSYDRGILHVGLPHVLYSIRRDR